MISSLDALLLKGLKELKIESTLADREKLLAYLALLDKWNKRFNLTAVRVVQEMVGRHLLDSLSILPYLHGNRLIDVGTGAGLPGIPLSILQPSKAFFLLDSNQKKQIFVSHVVKSLSLVNVQCVTQPVQIYQPSEKFSTILTRAFAPLDRMLALTGHLLANEGCFLAMMGKISDENLVLPTGYIMQEVVSLNVPGEKADRHLAIIVSA